MGLSEQVYKQMEIILEEVEQVIRSCSCQSGCPSCIGMQDAGDINAKKVSLQVIDWMLEKQGVGS